MSQSELADQLTEPISFQQIQKYERGSNRLSASKIGEFAEALQLPPAYFFPDTDQPDFSVRDCHRTPHADDVPRPAKGKTECADGAAGR